MSSNRFKFRRNGFTVLAVLHPCCVIGIPEPGLGVFFKGRFTNCRFFYNEQQPLPMKFTCAAWCQCMLLYEGEDGSLRRYVEVAEDGSGTFTVTITECQEQDEGGSLTEDSTGYIFHLDDGGATARQVLSAIERHYMFFTRKWIEEFLPCISPFLNHPEMVKELLKQFSGNDGLVMFLAGIVTDQDFPHQHAVLLRYVYGDYEDAVLLKAVLEVRKGTGELTMVSQPLPLRDFESGSSCSRTDDSSAYSVSLPSADPEALLKALKGVESFDSPYSSTTTAAGEDYTVDDVAESDPESSVNEAVEGVVQVAATTEEEESVTGDEAVSENQAACNREVYALVEKYGRDMIMKILLGGRLPEWLRPPPTPTCAPVQCQSVELSGTVEPFAPVQVVAGSKEDHESSNTAESDMYRS